MSASDVIRATTLAWDVYKMGWNEELDGSTWYHVAFVSVCREVLMSSLRLLTLAVRSCPSQQRANPVTSF
jgi:hypothetical protein